MFAVGSPPLWFLLLFPRNEHFFTSRDTLLSKQLRSQPGQTDVPLLPLTRTQFFETVLTVAPATIWTSCNRGM